MLKITMNSIFVVLKQIGFVLFSIGVYNQEKYLGLLGGVLILIGFLFIDLMGLFHKKRE